MRRYKVTGHSTFGYITWIHLEAADNGEMGGFSCIDRSHLPTPGEIVEAEGLGTFASEVYWHGEPIRHLLSERRA